MSRLPPLTALLVVVTTAVVACERPSEGGPESAAATSGGDESERASPLARIDDDRLRRVRRTHARLARGTTLDAAERADHLAEVLDHFAERPTPDRLDAARQAWRATLEAAEQTRPFARQTDGDGPNPLASLSRASPAPSTFEDAIDRNGTSVRDADEPAPFARSATEQLPALFGLELLFWGPDAADGAGAPDLAAFEGSGDAPAARRRLARDAVAALAERLRVAATLWSEGGARRNTFRTLDDRAALSRMIDRLVALLGDGLAAPIADWRKAADADGPSRYADASATVLRTRLRGVRNVYHGEYTRTDNSRIDGPGLSAVVGALTPPADRRISESLAAAAESLERTAPTRTSDEHHPDAGDALATAARRIRVARDALRDVEGLSNPSGDWDP